MGNEETADPMVSRNVRDEGRASPGVSGCGNPGGGSDNVQL